jgi:ketosteroid isomerase-like protein
MCGLQLWEHRLGESARQVCYIWRKQADSSWKVVLDVFNSDLPAPGM